MKRLSVRQCQNSDVKKVNGWPAGSHLVIQAFTSLPNILAPPLNAPLAVCSVSELCLEMYVNVFGRDALVAKKPNNNSLVMFHPLNEKRERMDLATIIRNILLI
jgi:hypothetical protein